MRPSFVIATVLFAVSVAIGNIDALKSLQGLDLILFVVGLFSGFVGLVNGGCEADGSMAINKEITVTVDKVQTIINAIEQAKRA